MVCRDLLSLYKSMVESRVLSEAEFWSMRVAERGRPGGPSGGSGGGAAASSTSGAGRTTGIANKMVDMNVSTMPFGEGGGGGWGFISPLCCTGGEGGLRILSFV